MDRKRGLLAAVADLQIRVALLILLDIAGVEVEIVLDFFCFNVCFLRRWFVHEV